jgi:hypothetical protein
MHTAVSVAVCQAQYDGNCSGEKTVRRIVCQFPIHYNRSTQFSADVEKRTSMSQIDLLFVSSIKGNKK